MKIRTVLFSVDRRMDRYDEANSAIWQVCEHAQKCTKVL